VKLLAEAELTAAVSAAAVAAPAAMAMPSAVSTAAAVARVNVRIKGLLLSPVRTVARVYGRGNPVAI
jgi:hypothetical protein